jgi:hypothetical protein
MSGYKKGEKAARIGLEAEEDIIDWINSDELFSNKIKSCLCKLGFDTQKEYKLIARKDNTKADIFIRINEKEEIGVSIKSSERTSFHQLDRRNLEDWKNLLNMPDDVFKTIKDAILRVARNNKDKFILEEDRCKIKEFISKNLHKMITEVFKRNEDKLKILIINDKITRKIYLFCINDVIEFIIKDAENNISFTKKGIIKLGRFVTIQRKGGNSEAIKIPKTDWEHPGNQLQFKFSPLKFAQDVKSKQAIKFCVIRY